MAIFNSFLYVYQAGSPQFLMKSPWKRWHRHRPQPRRSPARRRLRRSDATSVAAWRRSWNRPWILTGKNHGALGFSSSNSGDSMIWKRITRCPVRKPKTGEPKELCWGFGSEDVEVDQCDLKQPFVETKLQEPKSSGSNLRGFHRISAVIHPRNLRNRQPMKRWNPISRL